MIASDCPFVRIFDQKRRLARHLKDFKKPQLVFPQTRVVAENRGLAELFRKSLASYCSRVIAYVTRIDTPCPIFCAVVAQWVEHYNGLFLGTSSWNHRNLLRRIDVGSRHV
jgi:hypothetical protein